MIQKVVCPDYHQCLEKQREMGGEEEEEQTRKNSREALLKITLDFLRVMKQDELAERLQSSKIIYLTI